MARLHTNFQVGVLGASLTASGTTITFATAPGFPTVASPDTISITLEPGTSNQEIVQLTTYTATQTTGTITRGQEGTTGVAHGPGPVVWSHDFTALDVDSLPRGTLGYTQSTTLNQATITTVVDLTGMTTTVTVGSGSRRIRVSGVAGLVATVGTDTWNMAIQEGATVLQQFQVTPGTTTAQVPPPMSVILTPTAASHTYKLTGMRNGGTGSFTALAGATFPAYILVEDIGT